MHIPLTFLLFTLSKHLDSCVHSSYRGYSVWLWTRPNSAHFYIQCIHEWSTCLCSTPQAHLCMHILLCFILPVDSPHTNSCMNGLEKKGGGWHVAEGLWPCLDTCRCHAALFMCCVRPKHTMIMSNTLSALFSFHSIFPPPPQSFTSLTHYSYFASCAPSRSIPTAYSVPWHACCPGDTTETVCTVDKKWGRMNNEVEWWKVKMGVPALI